MQLIKSIVLTSVFSLIFYSSVAFAAQDGDYTYTESGGNATITAYTGTDTVIVIPPTLGGFPTVAIGTQAFFHLTTLTGVTIPTSVTSIGFGAFNGCTGLTSVTIPGSVTTIGAYAFEGCTGLTSVTITAGVISIGDGAFLGCTGLTSLTIPGSVTTIGGSAFQGCTGLTGITIPDNVTSMGGSVFYNCTGLATVSIPSSLSSIPTYSFHGCTSLTSVTIPASITSIGDYAFYLCTALTGAYFPGNAPTLGAGVFDNCASGFTVYYTTGSTGFTNPWYGYPAVSCTDSDHDGYSIEGGGCGAIDCNDNNSSINPGALDATCDGIDNNCDNSTDEGYVAPPTSCGVGACSGNTGVLSCVAGGTVDTCDPLAGATADTNCDGIDNNCDNQTDEGYVSVPTTCGVGACADTGSTSCVAGGVVDSCTPGTPSSDANCDGIDNNCDNQTDEGYVSVPTTCGVGACADTGSTSCVAGGVVDSCTPGTPSSDANCDGIDNNCDNQTDEGYVSVPTTCGVGACAAAGSTSCVAGGVVDSCAPGSPISEVCNGIDDDCDGEIDNGLTFKTYYRDADNDTYGDTDNATVACEEPEGYVDNSTGFDCNDNDSEVNPGATEVCDDGIDNNCNGQIDENCNIDNCTDADGDGYFAGEGCTPFDCDDSDWKINEGCEANPCSLKIYPKQIFKWTAFFEPVRPYLIVANKDSGVVFVSIRVRFTSDAIHTLSGVKIGKRFIFGFCVVNPFKLEKGDVKAEVELYGLNPEILCADLMVK